MEALKSKMRHISRVDDSKMAKIVSRNLCIWHSLFRYCTFYNLSMRSSLAFLAHYLHYNGKFHLSLKVIKSAGRCLSFENDYHLLVSSDKNSLQLLLSQLMIFLFINHCAGVWRVIFICFDNLPVILIDGAPQSMTVEFDSQCYSIWYNCFSE